MIITDVSGRIIQKFKVSGKQGQYIWDIRYNKPGMYFYNFTVSGHTKSGKMVLN